MNHYNVNKVEALTCLRECLRWLFDNNDLFRNFLPRISTIHHYLKPVSSCGTVSGDPLPSVASSFHIEKKIPEAGLPGILMPSEPVNTAAGLPLNSFDKLVAATQIVRSDVNLREVASKSGDLRDLTNFALW
jgi:hypothetical protein